MEKKRSLLHFQWIIILILSILIILLVIQNINYKKKYTRTLKQGKISKFEHDLKSEFLFEVFPLELKLEDFHFGERLQRQENDLDEYIIIIFDLTVCGKCLHEELRILSYFKEIAAEKNISFLAVVGITDKSEESKIINLSRSGELFFPVRIVEVDSLYRIFKLKNESYIDTPFFFYTSNDFRVLDIFKPAYLQTEEFYKWLEIILQ
ncbi:MAG: hypothetical protein KAW12_14490 [Candidatus Aminicenantes bacterium]|nr:hypothetical protein [Candidatus Aminicenantes bacterium]